MSNLVTPIVLIRPLGVGKSTAAEILAPRLGLERCCYDEIKVEYLQQAGLDLEEARRIRDEQGVFEMFQYTNQFEVEALGKVFRDHDSKVIDLGAGAHCFEEEAQKSAVAEIFSKHKHTILLMPSPELERSILALPGAKQRRYLNTHFIMHSSNEELSTATVYTEQKTPEQTADEIAGILGR